DTRLQVRRGLPVPLKRRRAAAQGGSTARRARAPPRWPQGAQARAARSRQAAARRMKATILYCDRCAAEGRGNVLATLIVWIRTSLGGHTVRLDVCSEHYAMIAGQSSSANGAAPTTERTWSPRAGKRALEGTYKAALAFAAKHERFSVDDLRGALGKMPEQRVTRVL